MIKLFVNNFWLKLISIILAIIVWNIFQEELISTRRIRQVPFQIALPKDMVIIDPEALYIDIKVSGPKIRVENLTKADIKIRYTLPETTRPGRVTLLINEQFIQLPKQILVKEVYPMQFLLDVDEWIEKDLIVKPTFSGKLSRGYRLDSIIADPNRIRLNGAKSILSSLEEIETVPVQLVDQNINFVQQVSLVSVPTIENESDIKVYVKIAKEYNRKRFKDIHVQILQDLLQQRFVKLSPDKVHVSLKGSEELLKRLTKKDIQVFVDISGLDDGNYELPLTVHTPEEIILANYLPKTLNVEIKSNETVL